MRFHHGAFGNLPEWSGVMLAALDAVDSATATTIHTEIEKSGRRSVFREGVVGKVNSFVVFEKDGFLNQTTLGGTDMTVAACGSGSFPWI